MVMPAERVRVVLADDDVLLREGLASLLKRSGYEVVAKSGSARELIASVARERPTLAIVDIRMPPNHTYVGIANQLWLAERTVEQHVRNILTKLQLPEHEDDHRRVLAVLTFLPAHRPTAESALPKAHAS